MKGFYHLPTHRRGAHTNFFDNPFLFKNRKFGHVYVHYLALYEKIKG